VAIWCKGKLGWKRERTNYLSASKPSGTAECNIEAEQENGCCHHKELFIMAFCSCPFSENQVQSRFITGGAVLQENGGLRKKNDEIVKTKVDKKVSKCESVDVGTRACGCGFPAFFL
jgi:hypothetical protein